ncbi:MAG: hypothetical protein K2X43_07865, partial [Hyphomonadaceae bacterium]|nr:hypothetical protein [Hyphomonadaceae bacterium]
SSSSRTPSGGKPLRGARCCGTSPCGFPGGRPEEDADAALRSTKVATMGKRYGDDGSRWRIVLAVAELQGPMTILGAPAGACWSGMVAADKFRAHLGEIPRC